MTASSFYAFAISHAFSLRNADHSKSKVAKGCISRSEYHNKNPAQQEEPLGLLVDIPLKQRPCIDISNSTN
jgi:hypothetical protein